MTGVYDHGLTTIFWAHGQPPDALLNALRYNLGISHLGAGVRTRSLFE